MIVPVVLLSTVLRFSVAWQSPTFRNKDHETLNVIFPDYPTVEQVVFEYAYTEKGLKHTTTVLKNSAGYFSNDLKKEKGTLIYSVEYYTNTGKLLHYQEGAKLPTPHVVPQHNIVRRGTTVLDETFASNHLDLGKWKHEITCWGGGNGEFQMYTPEAANTYVKNGILYLRPTFTADKFGENFLHSGTMDVQKQWGSCTSDTERGCFRKGNQIPPIMSSKIFSKASISHGRVEVVAQIPKGDWLWPAIWLLPPGLSWKYGGWPASGEIDIMEARGNLDLKDHQGNDHGINHILSTIHWGPDRGQHRQAGSSRNHGPGTWADGFHTYSLDWTADHISSVGQSVSHEKHTAIPALEWFGKIDWKFWKRRSFQTIPELKCRMDVDNQPIFSWSTPSQGYYSYSHFSGNNPWSSGGKDAPFDGKFSLILNVAVGGGFFDDSWVNKGGAKPWKINEGKEAMMDFWSGRQSWQSTWHGEDVAMKIKSVKMIQY